MPLGSNKRSRYKATVKPQFGERDLDGELVFDRYVGSGGDLDTLQAALREFAPRWSSKLRLWIGHKDQWPIDVNHVGALKSAVVCAAGERGATYRGLVERQGRPPLERLMGSAELRGASPELVMVVSIDEMVLSPLGAKKKLGNSLVLQVRRPKVEGRTGEVWLREAFETLCCELSPAWGSSHHVAEYWAKVMSDPPRVEAIGRDFGRFLPGLFWLNFLGGPYRELLGDDRLRATPSGYLTALGDGVLVALGNDPLAWDTPEYVSREQQVRDHLGAELFFSRAEPDRPTIVPPWDS